MIILQTMDWKTYYKNVDDNVLDNILPPSEWQVELARIIDTLEPGLCLEAGSGYGVTSLLLKTPDRKVLLDFADGFKAMDLTEIAVDERQGFRLDLEAEDPEVLLMSRAIIWATSDDMVVHRLKLIDLNSNSTNGMNLMIQMIHS